MMHLGGAIIIVLAAVAGLSVAWWAAGKVSDALFPGWRDL